MVVLWLDSVRMEFTSFQFAADEPSQIRNYHIASDILIQDRRPTSNNAFRWALGGTPGFAVIALVSLVQSLDSYLRMVVLMFRACKCEVCTAALQYTARPPMPKTLHQRLGVRSGYLTREDVIRSMGTARTDANSRTTSSRRRLLRMEVMSGRT